MSAVEVLSRDMWEEKRGILYSSCEIGGFGRAFLRGVLEAEEEKKCCLKKNKSLSFQNKPAGLYVKSFQFLGIIL